MRHFLSREEQKYLMMLRGRYEDECEFEDLDEYKEAIEKNLHCEVKTLEYLENSGHLHVIFLRDGGEFVASVGQEKVVWFRSSSRVRKQRRQKRRSRRG